MNETPDERRDAVAGPVDCHVRPLRNWRMRRAERRLAGLKAKYAATREMVAACEKTVPGALVVDMCELPRKIAEVEVLLKQLAA